MKDMSSMQLKTDVLTSTNDGLVSEKEHMTMELKETRELAKSYEAKSAELMTALTSTTTEYQELKREMITFDEMTRVRQERIEKLKKDLDEKIA
jgi:chromosome segregation ATPase